MPYRVPRSKVEARMLREVAAKHNELAQLQQEHSNLLFQHSLLTSTCELLTCILAQHMPHPGGDTLFADEQKLLQQLQELRCCSVANGQDISSRPANDAATAASAAAADVDPAGLQPKAHHAQDMPRVAADPQLPSCSGSGSNASFGNVIQMAATQSSAVAGETALPQAPAAALAAVQQQPPSLHDTLSPPDDVMLFCRRLLTQPLQVAHMTLQQLQEDYATTVCELSLNLTMLEQPHLQATCCAVSPMAVIEGLVCRHFHQLVSLVLMNRNDLVMAFYLSNCLSGAVGEGMHKPALLHTVLQLQLTPQQQQRIADGESLFKRLLAPVIQGRQQLQGVGFSSTSVHLQRSGSGSSSGSSSSFAADATAIIDELELMDGFPARTSALQKEQKKVASLSTLMKKELLLKACLTCFTVGCLTWAQAAQLLVTTFPFPPPLAALSQEIGQLWQQQCEVEAGTKRQFQPTGHGKRKHKRA